MSLGDNSYLITGAAGFIGSHLGNRLVEMGATVYGLDSFFHASKAPRKFYTETGDVRFPELLAMRAKNVDTIIHLAAAINVDFSHVMPDAAFDINLDGTLNVLEVARKMDKDVVYASSSEVYGTLQHTCRLAQSCIDSDECESSHCRTIDERHPLDGQSPYAASKIAADRACKAWADTYNVDVRVLRLFNTFGPWQADDGYGGVIAKFTKQALAGKPMQIYGSGEQRRDYLYIDDAVDAYVLALTSPAWPGPTNFSTGTTVSINELAVDIESLTPPTGTKRIDWIGPRLGEVDCLRGDWSRAKELGWFPKVSFKEGLERYVEWARNQT